VSVPQETRAASPARAGAKASHPTAAAQAEPPFARVFLALRGCTSCAHCRTSIRQMVRASAKGGEAALRDDKVEVRYATARAVPLREVIRSLAQSRLHDLSVVDVMFEATGTVTTAADGARRFVLAGTGQSFPVAPGTGVRLPAGDQPLRVVALVEGWRSKGAIKLVAREVRPAA
jgi:hypothetical protein